MTEEYMAVCKDCNEAFGYSEASLIAGGTRGLSRPERCPMCRRLHSRESRSMGIAQIRVKRIGPRRPDRELLPGRLGKIIHQERTHKRISVQAKFGQPDAHMEFGITDEDMTRLIEVMQKYQVTVVVGPTGSGKSTFLPYRLMVPPEGIASDILTRHGQIVVTQPRIQATRNIARFVARDLHGSSLGAGFDVGFRHSGAPASDWRNKLAYVTDGTLINWIVSGQISNLSVIMIDEAHERSLNIDLILGLLKKQLPRFPHLKLIIASATINAKLFQGYFGGTEKVGMLTFRGLKQHRVDAYFPNHDAILHNNRGVPAMMASRICDILLAVASGLKKEGDVLGFLPGEGPIEACVSRLRELIMEHPQLRERDIKVYPLYTRLPQESQDLALSRKTDVMGNMVLSLLREGLPNGKDRIMALFLDRKSAEEAEELAQKALQDEGVSGWSTMVLESGSTDFSVFPGQILFTTFEDHGALKWTEQYHVVTDRRVIISTNVAETSLTVDGVVYVVDSGLIKEASWDSLNSADDLPTIFHSRAGCRQRWGRAGRVRDGEAHMLYTDVQFEEVFSPYTEPEIRRSSLEEVILKAKAAGVDSIESFDWIEKPPESELKRAPMLLNRMAALDSDGDLTAYGVELQSFQTDVPVANLLVAADRFACGIEMATLAAMMPAGIRGGLFLWDNGWDFATRHAVDHIRASLSASCRDDLEFLFKLYAIWAEARDEKERADLCALYFLNRQGFENSITLSRTRFLEMLSVGKKAEEDRPINFDLLDRLRMVLSAFLPLGCVFHVPEEGEDPVSLDPETCQLSPQIDSDSVFSLRSPGYFAALKRRIVRRGDEQILSLSCIISLEKGWLAFRGLPHVRQALSISKEIRSLMTGKKQGAERSRLFLDVRFPVGTRYLVKSDEQGRLIPDQRMTDPVPIDPVFADGMAMGREEALEPSPDDVNPLSGWEDKADTKIAYDAHDEAEHVGEAMEDDGSAETEDIDRYKALPGSREDRVSEGLLMSEEIAAAREITPVFRCITKDAGDGLWEVTGHDFGDRDNPAVILADCHALSTMQDHTAALMPGEAVKVKVVETLVRSNGEKALRVMEETTKELFIVDPRSLTFSLNWSLVDLFEAGKTYEMIVEQEPQGKLRLSFLPVAAKRMGEFLADNPALCQPNKPDPVPCAFVERRFNNFYFILEPVQGSLTEPGLVVEMRRRREDKTHYEKGRIYMLYLDPQIGEADVFIPSPPNGLLDFVEQEKFSQGIFWNRRKLHLHTKRPLTTPIRDRLFEFSHTSEYRKSIQDLYRRSNTIRVLPVQPERRGAIEVGESSKEIHFQEGVPEYKSGEMVRGYISRIYDKHVLVILRRGGSGSISLEDLGKEGLLDPREVVCADEEIEAEVMRQTDRHVVLSMKKGVSLSLVVPISSIGLLIGKGGNTIKRIQQESSCHIYCGEDGTVHIKGPDRGAAEYASTLIQKVVPKASLFATS